MKEVIELLVKHVRPFKVGSREYTVVDDCVILEVARDLALPPWKVAGDGLEEGIVPLRYAKNLGALSTWEQARICRSCMLICGCGGLGGAIVHLAARLGFGRLVCVDPDKFVPSNANRQWFYFSFTDGKSKARSVAEFVEDINPLVAVNCMESRVSSDHLKGVDVVIDALDNVPDRVELARFCETRRLPLIHGAVRGWWGQVCTLISEHVRIMSEIYSESRGSGLEEELGVMAPVVSIVASIQVNEAVKIVAGQEPSYVLKLLYIDSEKGDFHVLPLTNVGFEAGGTSCKADI